MKSDTKRYAALRLALAGAAAGAMLTACGWNAKVEAPAVAMPSTFPQADSAASAASIADLPWWRYFNDPVLVEMIRTGLADNQNLSAAAARIDEAAALVAQARAQALPQVNLALATTPGSPMGSHLSSTFFGGLTVSWEFDFWGRYHAATQAARASFFASQADRDAARQSLVASIAATWFQLKSARRQIAVAQANAATAEDARRITALRTRQGVSSAVELRQAETQLYTVRDQIPVLEATAVQLEDALAVLLGQNPGQWKPPPAIAAADVTTWPDPPVGLPSALLLRRPDVVAAEQRLRAAGFSLASARATFLPSIGLTADAGRESTALDNLLRANKSGELLSVGPNASQPIFEGGALVAQVNQAKGARAEALANYRSAVLAALQGANDSLAAYRQARLRMAEAARLETAARETERLARERFAAGVTDFLEVLDSQRELYSAQLELSAALQYRNQAAVDLYRSLGGGWGAPEGADAPG